MKIIGVDPSLTNTGLIALDVDSGAVLGHETIHTKPGATHALKTADLSYRLFEIAQKFRDFCNRHGGVIVIEAQVGASMGRAGMGSVFKLGAAYGAILGACPTRPIVIGPPEVKRRLVGRSDASKLECWDVASKKLSAPALAELALVKSNANFEAVHDALAVAIAGLPEVGQIYAALPRSN